MVLLENIQAHSSQQWIPSLGSLLQKLDLLWQVKADARIIKEGNPLTLFIFPVSFTALVEATDAKGGNFDMSKAPNGGKNQYSSRHTVEY